MNLHQISPELLQFSELRYGLFIHFGLYSMLGRGEWVMNREGISREDYKQLANSFNPEHFNADEIAKLAVDSGMKYLIFTTMHHDGFRLYHSELTDFCSTKTHVKRDFTLEILTAARKHNLKVGLYHSLNNWMDTPDGVDALENPEAYRQFIENTHQRIEELVSHYQPFDILWYDGWWPFHARGWKSEEMNVKVKAIAPKLLLNGRNGLPGDFATPEQHLTAPSPWRPWEACVTLNEHWGYHSGDHHWKRPLDLIKMLIRMAQGRGNLLINIGPSGDGSIPTPSRNLLETAGRWLAINHESIWNTEFCTIDPHTQGNHRGDWSNHGSFTIKGNILYFIVLYEPNGPLVFRFLQTKIKQISQLGGGVLPFSQKEGKVIINLPEQNTSNLPLVYRIECESPPLLYGTGGLRIPNVPHPRYDPLPSDIAW